MKAGEGPLASPPYWVLPGCAPSASTDGAQVEFAVVVGRRAYVALPLLMVEPPLRLVERYLLELPDSAVGPQGKHVASSRQTQQHK